MNMVIVTKSASQTRELGETIGKTLKAGSVVCLTGDLGTGKTTLVQGIAKGLGVCSRYYITSPTFTLVNEYPGRLRLYHVDLYRLDDAVDFEDIGLLDLLFEQGAVVIEWAEKLSEELENPVSVYLESIDDHTRKIEIDTADREMTEQLKKLENQNKFH